MRLAILFSGGKDSVQCVEWAMNNGHEPAVLVTVRSLNPESYMYHVPNVEWTRLQAEAMGIPQIMVDTEGVKEEELRELENALSRAIDEYRVTGALSGAIFSKYQGSRVDVVCERLGLDSIAPLWRRTPREMLYGAVERGYAILMSAVAAGGLGQEWLGRTLDKGTVDELCHLHETCYVCTGGEGGEFETFVLDAPFFKKRIVVDSGEADWDGHAGLYRIREASLVEK